MLIQKNPLKNPCNLKVSPAKTKPIAIPKALHVVKNALFKSSLKLSCFFKKTKTPPETKKTKAESCIAFNLSPRKKYFSIKVKSGILPTNKVITREASLRYMAI